MADQQFDLDAAVAAGIIGEDQAIALRNFEAERSEEPAASEERFGLIGGFADIMAAVGLVLVAGTFAGLIAKAPPIGLLALPCCWWAAAYFTERRRLMLTSFVIFAVFALATALSSLFIALALMGVRPAGSLANGLPVLASVVTALVTAAACYLYWRRFRLPIAFAAFAVALINVAINLLRLLLPGLPDGGVHLVLALAGPSLFVTAMWWDISDIRRETIRSDVAFWLHIAAGFLLVKTVMGLLLGMSGAPSGWSMLFASANHQSSGSTAAAVIILFLLFAAVALIIDRRSLLTSGMFYVVPAMGSLGGIAPAFFLAGLLLTLLAIRWTPMRARLLGFLPEEIRAQVPRTDITNPGRRPTRRHLDLAPRRWDRAA
jgi:hypothetical protein